MPFAIRNIKRLIVFENFLIITSIDDNFVTIGLHYVEGTAIGVYFFELYFVKREINFEEGIVELISRFSSKNVNVLSNAAHGMTLDTFIGKLYHLWDFAPGKDFTVELFSFR